MDYMTNTEFDEDLRHDNTSAELSKEFRTLLVQMWIKNGSLQPKPFKMQVDRGMVNRRGFQQIQGWHNDSHEFLEFLLESLHEGLKYTPKIVISQKVDDDDLEDTDKLALEACNRWKIHFKNSYSSIIDLFYGQFLSEIRKNDEVSHCFDPFQVLTLEIPESKDGKEVTIMDCFEKFMSPEKITDNIQKTFYFWKTPKNLIICLKRFGNSGQKNDSRVVYSDVLDLSKFSKGYQREKIIYSLYGICCHHGMSQFGHYTSLCRKRGLQKWHKHDDEKVMSLGEGRLPLTSSAYILFYHQVSTST